MSTAIAKNTPWKLPPPFSGAPPLPPRPEYQLPAEIDIEPLSTQQKLALLQMSVRVSHQAIWREMKKKYEAPPFTLSTFKQLRQLRLAEILPDQHYHSLTTQGAQLCDLIGRQLVRDHNIHSPWIGGNDGALATLRCTCGWSCSMRRGTGMQVKASNAHSQHLRTVNAMDGLRTALAPRGKG